MNKYENTRNKIKTNKQMNEKNNINMKSENPTDSVKLFSGLNKIH